MKHRDRDRKECSFGLGARWDETHDVPFKHTATAGLHKYTCFLPFTFVFTTISFSNPVSAWSCLTQPTVRHPVPLARGSPLFSRSIFCPSFASEDAGKFKFLACCIPAYHYLHVFFNHFTLFYSFSIPYAVHLTISGDHADYHLCCKTYMTLTHIYLQHTARYLNLSQLKHVQVHKWIYLKLTDLCLFSITFVLVWNCVFVWQLNQAEWYNVLEGVIDELVRFENIVNEQYDVYNSLVKP